MSARFYNSCVNWPRHDVPSEGGLSDMIYAARMVTRRTFLRHADKQDRLELEKDLGYESHPKRGLTCAADFAVSYHKSKLHGKTVYYLRHSAIEYVFV